MIVHPGSPFGSTPKRQGRWMTLLKRLGLEEDEYEYEDNFEVSASDPKDEKDTSVIPEPVEEDADAEEESFPFYLYKEPIMDAQGYCRQAWSYAESDNLEKALEICATGLKVFPNNMTLLTYALKFSTQQGDMQTARQYYGLLHGRIPRRQFDWRAYTVSLRYLMEDVAGNEALCRELIADYTRRFPYQEKALAVQSELETMLGNHQRSMQILEEAVEKFPNAAQCAMNLAEQQLERGLYEKVLHTTAYGLTASAAPQMSVNCAYFHYFRVLAKDALLHRRAAEGTAQKEEAEQLLEEYKFIHNQFRSLRPHNRNLLMRIHSVQLLCMQLT